MIRWVFDALYTSLKTIATGLYPHVNYQIPKQIGTKSLCIINDTITL
jgi:hypothetical protein